MNGPDVSGLRPAPAGLDRRAFLRHLGGGLLLACSLDPARARALPTVDEIGPEDRGQRPARQIAAWLHIGPDGEITAYTGKVEIGQNARTSLTQAVAEELRVPYETVRVVMGDTALVQVDIGTFASLTTPVMFAQLRRAGAAARELLLDRAVADWKVDRAQLVAAEGKVAHPPTGRSVAYGALAEAAEMVAEIDEHIPLTPPVEWQVAGRPIPKVGARNLVTGRHKFASDLKRPNMLYGQVLRPPAYGLTLASLDDSAARKLPDVTIVRDGPFAGVVAADRHTAGQAIAAMKPEWQGKPPEGTEGDILDRLRDRKRPAPDDARSRIHAGDLDAALASASVRLSQSYSCAYIAHVALEPRACIAEWDGDRLTVWTGTQVPFGIRAGLARTFQIPETSVRVIVPDTGSGYGSKHAPDAEIECARLARAVGRPVRLGWSREEEFTWNYFRPAGIVDATAGAASDGALAAWEFHNINSGVAGLDTPYRVPARRCEFHPSDSPLRQGAYRALASTLNHFARESLMDELARALKLDPLAFRLRNLEDERLIEALRRGAERFGWPGSPAPGRGLGLACGAEKGAVIATFVEVAVEPGARRLQVVRVLTAFSPGAIVSPDHLANQIEGAAMMGLGGALFESLAFRDGKLRNARLSRYRVPRFTDMPRIEALVIDRKDLPAGGAGEIPLVGIAPALANAIADATGTRLRALPLVPDAVVPA